MRKQLQETISPEVVEAIVLIVSHYWESEEADYLATTPFERVGHIFPSLQRLRNWLLWWSNDDQGQRHPPRPEGWSL